MASMVLICAELGFYGLLHHFKLLMHPVGKGVYCLFLGSFFVNDNKDSYLYIINIVVGALGLSYVLMGTFCEKKKLNQVQNALTTEHDHHMMTSEVQAVRKVPQNESN